MKNIHILQTDKPSNIVIATIDGKLKLNNNTNDSVEYHGENQHIYITSDEEIKEGDWVITPTNDIIEWAKVFQPIGEKIILTTNKKLIRYGVQAIDDEFLEWFVKNPSCEWVKIKKYHGINTSIAEVNAISGDVSLNWQGKSDLRDYKIIIPKPTQQVIDEDFDGGLTMGEIIPKEETIC